MFAQGFYNAKGQMDAPIGPVRWLVEKVVTKEGFMSSLLPLNMLFILLNLPG